MTLGAVCAISLQLIEVQAEYHRKSLALLQNVLPQIKAQQGECMQGSRQVVSWGCRAHHLALQGGFARRLRHQPAVWHDAAVIPLVPELGECPHPMGSPHCCPCSHPGLGRE